MFPVPEEEDHGEASDCESVVSVGSSSGENEEMPHLVHGDLVRIKEDDPNRLYHLLCDKIVAHLKRYLGFSAPVEAVVYRNIFSSFRNQARHQIFSIFAKAVERSRGGNPNVKFAWYGASKDEALRIISHGFGGESSSNGGRRHGVYLSPLPFERLESCVADENGVRYLLLCRVILGRVEVVHPGSGQSCPSSEEFDSAVDNLVSPRNYIVWNTHMNTHILPEFVISFRAPIVSPQVRGRPRPYSPWMPFLTLISELTKVLPPEPIELIKKFHDYHRERRITRQELVCRVRHIAGDRLLMSVIKSCREKRLNRGDGPLN